MTYSPASPRRLVWIDFQAPDLVTWVQIPTRALLTASGLPSSHQVSRPTPKISLTSPFDAPPRRQWPDAVEHYLFQKLPEGRSVHHCVRGHRAIAGFPLVGLPSLLRLFVRSALPRHRLARNDFRGLVRCRNHTNGISREASFALVPPLRIRSHTFPNNSHNSIYRRNRHGRLAPNVEQRSVLRTGLVPVVASRGGCKGKGPGREARHGAERCHGFGLNPA